MNDIKTIQAVITAKMYGIPKLKLPEPKPRGYYVHLSKTQRKGKTYKQLRAMRESSEG